MSSKSFKSDIDANYIKDLARTISDQELGEALADKVADSELVLKMVGAGLFLAAAVVAPGLTRVFKPHFFAWEKDPWRRFNIKHLKQTIKRLEKRQLLSISQNKSGTVVELTKNGERQVIKMALEKLAVTKPRLWDGRWWLVTYDIPEGQKEIRAEFREYLLAWGFYPLQDSVFLHCYPCLKQVNYLREYLGIGEMVRIFKVAAIENDQPFKEFFGV